MGWVIWFLLLMMVLKDHLNVSWIYSAQSKPWMWLNLPQNANQGKEKLPLLKLNKNPQEIVYTLMLKHGRKISFLGLKVSSKEMTVIKITASLEKSIDVCICLKSIKKYPVWFFDGMTKCNNSCMKKVWEPNATNFSPFKPIWSVF